jgi:hypothetical protein
MMTSRLAMMLPCTTTPPLICVARRLTAFFGLAAVFFLGEVFLVAMYISPFPRCFAPTFIPIGITRGRETGLILKVVVRAGLVRLSLQFGLQVKQVAFEVELERRHVRTAPLAARRALEGLVQILEFEDSGIKMFVCFQVASSGPDPKGL